MTPRCQAVILKLKERADKHMEDHTAQVRREREREQSQIEWPSRGGAGAFGAVLGGIWIKEPTGSKKRHHQIKKKS